MFPPRFRASPDSPSRFEPVKSTRARRAGYGRQLEVSRTLATVLVVDDDEAVVQTLARMLQLDGYEVSTALDAEAALLEVARSHPDAVIVDLRMPLTDGLMFLRRLRSDEQTRRTPVAILTGDTAIDDATKEELKELTAELYFKPVWFTEIIEIAQRLIQQSP